MSAVTFPEVLDSSLLAQFKSCPQKFFKSSVQHWRSKEPSVHLHAGGAFAHGIERTRREFFINSRSAEDSIALGLQALLDFYGDFQCPGDSAKSPSRMAGAFEFYWENYPLERTLEGSPYIFPGEKHAIEFNFAEPLPILHPETGNPLLYCGRMDALLNFAGGLFICDEKTTSSLGPSWSNQWELRSQFTGYAWGAAAAGIKVDGALVRGVSILKTKYETQQAIVYRPSWQVDRWYAELLLWIEQMLACWRSGVWSHNLDHSCTEYGGCEFRRACSSQDETPWLETYFERRAWNPLTREEVKL